ncbi:MAG: diadenosine tetraphosphate hydrolase [Phycisphaerae bacterium]|nr:diadenosine tetraphosphate hydrolase [Phycisphaerae bacterium]
MSTVFAKIIDGEIPCHKVYEDEQVLAFLDVSPLSNGHTLLIPKQIASSLHELSEDSASALGIALVRVSKAVLKATGATSYNILQNNGKMAHQAVFQVHFHIIPTYTAEDGLVLDWIPKELANGEVLAKEIQEAF